MNAKSFHKRGQALLLLSGMQQRSKVAMKSFQRALQLGNLPASAKKETQEWYKFAKKRWDEDTPLPGGKKSIQECVMQ